MKHSDYLKKKKTRETRKKIISVISAIVVFITTYALVLPAITLDVSRASREPGIAFEQMQFKATASAASVTAADSTVEEVQVEEPAAEEAAEEEIIKEEAAEIPEEETSAVSDENEKEEAEQVVEEAPAAEAEEVQEEEDKSAEEKADAEPSSEPAQEEAQTAETQKSAEQTAVDQSGKSEAGATEAASAATTTETAAEFQIPTLDPIDFDDILTGKTDFYFYHVEKTEEDENITSDSVDDWKKVGSDTVLAPEDFIRVYLSYEIPAGSLNETNAEARYRLPAGLELSDKQIKDINKYENGIAASKSGREHDKYLGAEAIEGSRTPNEKAGDEYISATVKAEKVYKDGEYVGQDLIFTFIPYTVEKNQISYDEAGKLTSEGRNVKGFFTFDLTTAQIDFEKTEKETVEKEDGTKEEIQYSRAEVVFVKENNKKNIDEISRILTVAGPSEKEEPQVQEPKTLISKGEGNDYTVTVSYTDDAQIPDNAELSVREIEKGTDEYDSYLEQAQAVVEEGKAVNEARFFDITILVDDENGEGKVEFEPKAPVSVQIVFSGIEKTSTEDTQLLHYTEDEVQVMDQAEFSKSEEPENGEAAEEKPVDTVQFETDGFSVFGIVGTELVTDITLPGSDDTYEVTVTYGPEAEIPENVHLEVGALSEENPEYQKAKEALIVARQAEDESFDESKLGFAALDISIVDNETNEKIEPAEGAEVKVSFKMNVLPEGETEDSLAETMEIQHLNESTGVPVIETVANASEISVIDGSAEAEFTIDSFSTFSVTWSSATNTSTDLRLRAQGRTGSQYNNTVGQVEVNYVSSDGVAITRPTAVGGSVDINVIYRNNNFSNHEVVISSDNVARTIDGRTFERAYIIDGGQQKDITRILFSRTGYNSWSTAYYNGNTLVTTASGNNVTGTWRIPIYLQYSGDSGANTANVYYVDEDGNELNIANTASTYPDLGADSTSPAYLIYDIDGYQYSYTYRNTDNTENRIRPRLQRSGSTWQYCPASSSTYSNLSDGDDIYVVYKKKDAPAIGGTPNPDIDETWPDEDDDGNKPVFSKSSINQGDGTNLISLSITGTEKPITQATPADVIVVFDISDSMQWRMDSNQAPGAGQKSRLDLAKEAVNEMANILLNGENDNVRMALVSFDTDARVNLGFTSSYDDYTSAVNGLSYTGRTNWEKGLYLANTSSELGLRENAATFVIFVTDGDPTVRMSRGNLSNAELASHGMSDSFYNNSFLFGDGGLNETNYSDCYDPAVPQVQSIVGSNKAFYAVGITNNVSRLEQLVTDAGVNEDHAFSCTDEDQLEDAFDSITQSIKTTLGFGDVEVTDGITELANVEMKVMQEVDPDSFTYYKVTSSGRTEWNPTSEGAGLASYNSTTGAVTWDMGESFQLEDGVTYEVTFRVWPSQEAYDLIADLNNGVKVYEPGHNNSITDDEHKQVVQLAAPTATTQGNYTLKTNTDSVSATYSQTSSTGETVTVSGDTNLTATYHEGTIENMPLTSQLLTIKKIFEESLDPRNIDSVTLKLQRADNDGNDNDDDDNWVNYNVPGTDSPYIELGNDNNWEISFFVAPGFILNNKILEHGYKFTVTEPTIGEGGEHNVRYDLIPEIVNPMVVNGQPQLLGDGDGNQSLTAINRTRSAVEIHKTLYDVDGTTQIYPDTEFTITGKLLDPEGNPYTNQEQADPAAYYLYDREGNATTGRLHFPDSSNISFTLKAGEFIRFVNVPEGCTFEFTEGSMPDNYELKSLGAVGRQRNPETDPAYTYSIELSDEAAHLVEGETTISTTTAGIIGNTNYKLDFYNKRVIPLPEVELVKVDQNDNTKKLNGAQFELHKGSVDGDLVTTDGNGNPIAIVTGDKEDSASPDGWYLIGLLPAGTYYLVETVEPDDYLLDDTPVIITVAQVESSYTVTATKEGENILSGPTDGIYTITVENERSSRWVQFKKTDMSSNPLGEAEFSFNDGTSNLTLTSYDPNTTIEEKDVSGLMRDSNGIYTFELTYSDNAYPLIETNPPTGYYPVEETILVRVQTNGVTATGEKTNKNYPVTGEGTEENPYVISVANSDGTALPNTGGPGTLPYTLGGIALIFASALMYGFRMRRRERRLN